MSATKISVACPSTSGGPPGLPVAESGWHDEEDPAAGRHSRGAAFPAGDHLARAEQERLPASSGHARGIPVCAPGRY